MAIADQDAPTQDGYFVSGRELQRRFDISSDTLRLWRQKGLPHVGGVGVHPRYPLAEAIEWLRRRSRNPEGAS